VAYSGSDVPPIPGAERIWLTPQPANRFEIDLFRKTFTIGPGVINTVTLTLAADGSFFGRLNRHYLGMWALSSVNDPRIPIVLTLDPSLLNRDGRNNVLIFTAGNHAPFRDYYSWLAFKLEVT